MGVGSNTKPIILSQALHYFCNKALDFRIFNVFLAIILFKFVHSKLWVPWRIQTHFRKQGMIKGPPYRPITGNTNNIHRLDAEAQEKAMPYIHQWSEEYGKTFVYWFGSTPRLTISDLDVIKEVLMNTNGSFTKTKASRFVKFLIGKGLAGLDGEKWALHRRIANQAFTVERVKV